MNGKCMFCGHCLLKHHPTCFKRWRTDEFNAQSIEHQEEVERSQVLDSSVDYIVGSIQRQQQHINYYDFINGE